MTPELRVLITLIAGRPPAAINILTSEPSHMTTPGRLIMWLHVIHESRPELPTTDAMTETNVTCANM